ncbi:alpha subunit of geranylgeranyl transferase type 2 [Spathaspora passalidarum NRRL Y-27907]|uniref:Geranylgeranyl transferase type-2 subunit alpha n=1 Tax=Spathaspora passalidarum (strain NRRL Y-27907 / 11-Y1) TaxID=619300 RepID=G3AFK3_SPAPN|nr:alpha subunit of geranylgeranyl transferase type 2 [Spathaspora passalidarum NRRL Y-27907]EGW34992.1 alpha subunit of geranylgeranyl transferase type 2 [Spathaspora passalidarum NRRL Y-27907]
MQHNVKRVNISAELKKLKLEKDQLKIKRYQELTAKLFDLRDNNTYTQDAFNETTTLLLMNPEFYTVWNYRREILSNIYKPVGANVDDYAQVLNDELQLVLQQLKKFPKCYWIWNHRRWCLFELVALHRVNWMYEFAVVSKLLELDQRNFHGWQYRRFIVENIEKESVAKDPSHEKVILLKIKLDEFDYTTTKVQSDFSNFSAWHNRGNLIPKIYKLVHEIEVPAEFKERVKLFDNPYDILIHELDMIKTGIYMSPEDTSIWSYYNWLLTDDFFTKAYSKEEYLKVLHNQLEVISEVNELEKEDNGQDNIWCLKSIIFTKTLINKQQRGEVLTDEIKSYLKILIKIDPLRKGKYEDQLRGVVGIV